MCNLYSITKGPQAIRDFAHAMRDTTGNLPPIPGVFPDCSAPIVPFVRQFREPPVHSSALGRRTRIIRVTS